MAGMAADCLPVQAEKQEHLSSELHQILSSIGEFSCSVYISTRCSLTNTLCSPFYLIVHRCSRDVLRKALPFKNEVIIHIRQSKPQAKLYREFKKYQRANNVSFWEQYHALRPVSNHPACLSFFRDKSCSNSPASEFGDHQMVPGAPAEPRTDQDLQEAPDGWCWTCDICKKATFKTVSQTSICFENLDAASHCIPCDNVYSLKRPKNTKHRVQQHLAKFKKMTVATKSGGEVSMTASQKVVWISTRSNTEERLWLHCRS
jgi:hypothetical protein